MSVRYQALMMVSEFFEKINLNFTTVFPLATVRGDWGGQGIISLETLVEIRFELLLKINLGSEWKLARCYRLFGMQKPAINLRSNAKQILNR